MTFSWHNSVQKKIDSFFSHSGTIQPGFSGKNQSTNSTTTIKKNIINVYDENNESNSLGATKIKNNEESSAKDEDDHLDFDLNKKLIDLRDA